jgi:hypothetical protein
VSAPTERPGRVPNDDRRPGERSDLRPHGTEARARREWRRGQMPCAACLAASAAAHRYRTARRASQPGKAR